MKFYLSTDRATAFESDFASYLINDFAEDIVHFFDSKYYGDTISELYLMIIFRNSYYFENGNSESFEIRAISPTKFRRKDKELMFIVEIKSEIVSNSRDIELFNRVASKALLQGLKNANEHSRVRIDFNTLISDVTTYLSEKGWYFEET